MAHFFSPLRSWLKEERRLLLRSARLWWVGLSSLMLVVLLLAAEVRRRESRISAALESKRLEKLELVAAALSDIRRTAFDWARWQDALDFVQGRNPAFVQRDMAQSSLFAAGGSWCCSTGMASPWSVTAPPESITLTTDGCSSAPLTISRPWCPWPALSSCSVQESRGGLSWAS